MKLSEIRIEKIKNLIPRLLYVKLTSLNIENVENILKIDILKFSKIKGTGRKAINQLYELQLWIRNNEDSIIEIGEKRKEQIIILNEDSELKNIKLNKIISLIPSKLFSKFEKNEINTLADLSSLSKEKFLNLKGVGEGTIELLDDFIDKLKSNPSLFYQTYLRNSKGIAIPEKFNFEENVILLIKNLIDDYVKWLKETDSRYADFLVRYFGLQNNTSFSFEDIGLYFELSRERVRQVIERIFKDLEKVIKGENSSFSNVYCNKDLLPIIKGFYDDIVRQKVISYINLKKDIQKKHDFKLKNDLKPYMNLFFRATEFQINGKAENKINEELFYFSKDAIDKKHFFDLGKLILDTLKKAVIPIEEFELIIKVRKKRHNAKNEDIKFVINRLSEIESFDANGKKYTQIKLQFLSTAGDMVERVLYKKGESTHIDILVNQVNRHLFLSNSTKKEITKNSALVGLKNKENIRFKGKTGIYFFINWEENNDSIQDLVRKAFLQYNHPLSHSEIIKFIKGLRASIKERSIRTVINIYFTRLKGNRYILPEWENRYKGEIFKKKNIGNKKTRIEQVIEVLEEKENQSMNLKELSKYLSTKLSFPYTTMRHTLGVNFFFNKEIDKNGNKIIKLTGNKYSDYKKINQDQIIKEEAKKYFEISSSKNSKLSEFIKQISKNTGIINKNIYKAIDKNPTFFKKETINKTVYISLRVKLEKYKINKTTINNWDLIKEKLERELKEKFEDIRQPTYSNSLSEGIQLFYEVVKYETSTTQLNGLHEQLIPTLHKFYSLSNDSHDLLNHFKQIATSLDPYLQKIVYLIDNSLYLKLKQRKAGLGRFIKELNKLDSSENRYKSNIKSAQFYKFGKDMFTAYNTRNNITHMAGKWSRNKLVGNITSILTIYIFATLEYYKEIKNKI